MALEKCDLARQNTNRPNRAIPIPKVVSYRSWFSLEGKDLGANQKRLVESKTGLLGSRQEAIQANFGEL